MPLESFRRLRDQSVLKAHLKRIEGQLKLRVTERETQLARQSAALPCDDLLRVGTPTERGSEEPQAAFHFRPLTQANAEAIALWHYPEPFSFYDWAKDPNDLAELLDPALRGDAYFAVETKASDLIGYFSFKRKGPGTLEIGLGLDPEHTGQGLGVAFLQAGLDYARSRFEPAEFVLSDLRGPDGRLLRSWRDGAAGGPGYADDHALLASALLTLMLCIGANTTIDRATFGNTVVRRGTKIDNLVHIGHDTVIGKNCAYIRDILATLID